MDILGKEIVDDELDAVVGGRSGRHASTDNYNASVNYSAADSYEKIRARLIEALNYFSVPTNGVPAASKLSSYGIVTGVAGAVVYECKRSDGTMVRCSRA